PLLNSRSRSRESLGSRLKMRSRTKTLPMTNQSRTRQTRQRTKPDERGHEPMTTTQIQESIKHERLHALDALRAVAMVLGVWLHAALPYVAGIPPFFWAASDPRKSDLIGFFVTLIHSWRMEVFFLLSGFFTAMLVIRRGAKSTFFQRFKRIVIPFVLAMVIIQP